MDKVNSNHAVTPLTISECCLLSNTMLIACQSGQKVKTGVPLLCSDPIFFQHISNDTSDFEQGNLCIFVHKSAYFLITPISTHHLLSWWPGLKMQ